MTQVGPTSNQLQHNLGSYRLEERERHSKMLVLGFARPFPNIEAVYKQCLADVCGIARTIKLPVAHQHVQPVHAARQAGDGASWVRHVGTSSANEGFDRGSLGRHATPARPPGMRGAQTLNQHWTRSAVDSYPRFPVQGSE